MNPLQKIIPEKQLSLPEYRDWIMELHDRMLGVEESVERGDELNEILPVKHTFTPFLYTREISMPKGQLVMSRIHLFEHPFVISKGVVSVYDGTEVVTLEAPYQGVTKAGTKRILYIHEDTVWTTFHAIDATSIEEVEKSGVIVCDRFEEFDSIINKEIPL